MSTTHDGGDGQELGLPDLDRDPRYGRIRDAIGETGAGMDPKPGWQAEVWERIARGEGGGARNGNGHGAREAPARWGRARTIALGAAFVAAAAALLVALGPWHDRPRGAQVARSVEAGRLVAVIEREPGPERVRGHEGIAVQDALRVASPGAVWIYRGEDRLLLDCHPGALTASTCTADGAGVRARLVADAPGRYHVIVTLGAPGPAPATLDLALATLTRADARFDHQQRDVY